MADTPKGFQAGQTALVVRVPEAEPAVGTWRERLDPTSRTGVPAHVTVLFPFLHADAVDDAVCAALEEAIGRHRPFDVRFERSGRFPGLLYLAPEPDAPFRRLTEEIAERWPEAPPYGGKYEPVPHLTVAQTHDESVLAEADPELAAHLPVAARVTSVDLVVFDGTGWRQRAAFALGRPDAPGDA
ncbi:2'-5' RNA ligase family protein [Streptomyces sp. NPDC002144]